MKRHRLFTTGILLLVLLAQAIPASQPVRAVTYCDWAGFVSDVTVPDGTNFAPDAKFTKTWRLKNIGTCSWTTSYSLVFYSGEQMGTTAAINLPNKVDPGQTIDLSVEMTAPSKNGTYRGNWELRNAAGVLFGIGSKATSPFWVEIKVSTTYSGALDFVADAGKAVWSSGAGALTFPGTEGDAKGFALKLDNPKLENGTTDSNPGLLVGPQNVTDGYIQGVYPDFAVQKGDRFQSIVNCAAGATNCYVVFKLDYQIGGGAVKNYWTFYERYEGLYYRADVDLSALAGQNVKFILKVGAYGSASGDKALWGGARIVRPGGGTITPTPTPTVTGTPSTSCDKAAFVADVTVPDGTLYAPGTSFNKTWRLKNNGTCKWTTSYSLIFDKGDQMNGPATISLPKEVSPGQTIDLTVTLTAPATAGTYRGYWKLKNASGAPFGIGASGTSSFWVEIKVSGPTPTPTVTPTPSTTGYDFVAKYCDAQWTSGAGALACPGTDGDSKGFVIKLDAPKLENGTTSSQPGLLTFPQNVTNGFIQGVYPAFSVQSGDRFQATVNCQYQATGCNVIFRLDYQIDGEAVKTLWSFNEAYEGLFYKANVDLSSLAGKQVKFILTITANGSPANDRALWVGAQIVR
jgi:hypothetical protein